MSPADKILQKALIASGNLKPGDKEKLVDTAGWSKVQAGLRDRAFFSSQVTEAKILHAMRQNVAELVAGGKSPSEVRRDLRAYLGSIGYAPAAQDAGTIKDLTTKSRLDVMMKTNADQAKGYASHLRATTAGAILAFPAYELVRVERRKLPRDWGARWAAAAQKVGWEGVARNGAMIALKTSPIWAALSRFGNPFPPFDFNSGMGVRDVKKSVCREIGLLGPNEQPEIPQPPDFNGNLAEKVQFDKSSKEYSQLKRKFGDQIQFNEEKHEIQWRSDLFADMFDPGKKFTIKLGEPTKALLDKLPSTVPVDSIAGKHLTINERWLDKKRKDGETDHRIHFELMPEHPEDIPLKKGDVDMLPSLWRNPDRVFEDHGSMVLEVDAVDGGMFRAIVKPGNSPNLKTFYRTTESWEEYLKKRMARDR